jgi:hypothetical protein
VAVQGQRRVRRRIVPVRRSPAAEPLLPLLRYLQHDLATPVPGLQTLVHLAYLVEGQYLVHQGLYLAALDETGYLVEPRPLAR